jgi:ABC-2 type transport system permease protein
MRASLFDPHSFYFHLMMESGTKAVLIPLPQDLSPVAFERGIESGLKRFSVGFLRTVALTTAPPEPHYTPQTGFKMEPEKHFDLLKNQLTANYAVNPTDLKNGVVPEETDLLFMAAPKELDEKQLFAMDQFLMKGGTVILMVSPYYVKTSPLSASLQNTGLKDWLDHMGVTLKQEFVLDTQSTPFPIPVERRVGMFVFQEMKMINYPYFVDVRGPGFAAPNVDGGAVPSDRSLGCPHCAVNPDKNKGRTVTELLKSSPKSWTSESVQITPNWIKGDRALKSGTPWNPVCWPWRWKGNLIRSSKKRNRPLLPEKKGSESKEPKRFTAERH